MAASDLTNLAAVKAWLGLPSSASPNDATLATLITAASRMIYAWLARPTLLPQGYSETIDFESARITLRHWPVTSVSSLTIDGVAIPPVDPNATPTSAFGYALRGADIAPPGQQQAIDVFGYRGWRRRQNVVVSYGAGYAVSAEPRTVPASSPFQLNANAPFGPWGSDQGVVYASSGAAMAPVASAPAIGQYAVTAGVYTFAAADAGATVLIAYGYVPQDLMQAATELAAERFRAAEHIGQRSKSLGGQETITFDVSGMSAGVLALLQPYRRVTI
jgi:hypothetical protein